MLVQKYISGQSAVKIASSFEAAIARGTLGAGEPLPPVRALAESLRVSPATAAAAYRLLKQRGIVTADGRRGTRVRPAPPIALPTPALFPSGVRNLAEGNPDLRLLPSLAAALQRSKVEQRLYGGTLNEPHLLQAARSQFAGDSIPAHNIAVVSGALDGVERVLREQLRPGDRVIVEDPCFTGILDLLHSLSLVAVPVRVDDEGILPAEMERAVRGNVAAVIVTPRAQNPTGAAFSSARARKLRESLDRVPELLLIEDDHAGPVAGAPYRTLVSSARTRWAVVRSVSKSLGPDLRLAILAGDSTTVSRIEGRQTLGVRWVSHILQRTVATLWSDRSVQALLRRAHKTYAERRAALIDALSERGIHAHGASGLNVWIPVPEETTVVQELLQRGWAVQAGERYRMRSPPAVRITTAALEPVDSVHLAEDLAATLQPRRRASVS